MNYSQLTKALSNLKGEREAVATEAENLRGLVEELANELDEFISGKSERWAEGEKGEAYGQLRDELSAYDTELEEIPELNL